MLVFIKARSLRSLAHLANVNLVELFLAVLQRVQLRLQVVLDALRQLPLVVLRPIDAALLVHQRLLVFSFLIIGN